MDSNELQVNERSFFLFFFSNNKTNNDIDDTQDFPLAHPHTCKAVLIHTHACACTHTQFKINKKKRKLNIFKPKLCPVNECIEQTSPLPSI